ncbi:MAG: hypothetical protein RL321_485, partial [Pseudomonadota bacterium]
VAGYESSLVRSGRLELPYLSALAPQASVSTNSTTTATSLSDLLTLLWRHRWCVRQCRRRIRRRHLLDGLAEQTLRSINGAAGTEPRERQTVDHENRSEDRRGARQACCGTTRTKHAARSARAKTGTRIGATATLQQHERDDRDRNEYLQYGQSGQQHVIFTFQLHRLRRRSPQIPLLSARLRLSGHRRHPALRKSLSHYPP